MSSTGAGATGVLLAGVIAGILEEPGWRGYAQDRLHQHHHVLVASLTVGVLWATWHLPLFFIAGPFQNGLGAWTPRFWLFGLNILTLAFIYAWVYVGTHRSILAVIALNATSSTAGGLVSVDGAEGSRPPWRWR